MTRKFWIFAACGLATVGLFCAGAHAQAVRLVADDASSYFTDDADGNIVPTSTPPAREPAPKKPSIGSGLDSLSSPSDVPPTGRPKPPMPRPPAVTPAEPPMPPAEPMVGPTEPPFVPGDYPPSYVGPGCDGVAGYGEPSCGDDSYCPSSCCCGPAWTFRAEALIWDRVNTTSNPLATGSRTIFADDYNFGWAAGPRLTAIRHGVLGGCWDAEFIYFGITGWGAAQNMADVDTIFTDPATNVGGVTPLASTYNSRLYSTEVNLKRAYNGSLSWLVGVRYVEVQETLNMDIGGVATENFDVDNHLYGVQVGLDGLLLNRSAWFLTGWSKLGVFGNSSDTALRTAGVGGARAWTGASGSDTALLADMNLTAGYRVTDSISLLAGYNVLWIDGIADAPSQINTHNIVSGAASVEANNTAFYHGVNLGVQWLH